MNREALTASGEAMLEALGRESYLAGAGLKAEPEFQAIYDRHQELVSDEALGLARSSGAPALLEWVVDVRLGRSVAALEEQQLAWEQRARVSVNGHDLPYLRVPIELANSPDRAVRIALDEARVAAAGAIEDLRRRRFRTERDILTDLGFADPVDAFARLSGIDVVGLARAAGDFLARTRDMYVECLGQLTRRRVGVPVGELVRADAGWTFRADRFDHGFPAVGILETATRQMREMGLDATQDGRVRVDTEEREGKQPRAFCAPVRVPDEVYLVIRPRGGHQDYRTFWHELGHAMHYASVSRELPFEGRWLGDNSVTEGFAMLWDHLTMSVPWLRRYADIGKREIADLIFELTVYELYLARRYAAKLRYELELHRSDYSAMGARYAELLTDATGFRFPVGDHLHDVDPGFYAARYLRAWQLEAAFAGHLTERFGPEWFRSPAAGRVVQEWMSWGQQEPAHRLAHRVLGVALDFERVAERFNAMLSRPSSREPK
jgi:hypothetical protein